MMKELLQSKVLTCIWMESAKPVRTDTCSNFSPHYNTSEASNVLALSSRLADLGLTDYQPDHAPGVEMSDKQIVEASFDVNRGLVFSNIFAESTLAYYFGMSLLARADRRKKPREPKPEEKSNG